MNAIIPKNDTEKQFKSIIDKFFKMDLCQYGRQKNKTFTLLF